MKSSLPFARWLPILDLGIWVSFFAIPAAIVLMILEVASLGSGVVHSGNGVYTAVIPRSQFLFFAVQSASFQNSHTIMALNTPGMFGEVLVSLFTTWPSTFRPSFMMIDEWRCLSLPIFCMPAWWLVGIGFDGWIERRKIHWSLVLLGTLLSVLFAALFLGLRFGMSAAERGETAWPLWGLGLWAVLFATLPCAWWRQKRSSRIEAAA